MEKIYIKRMPTHFNCKIIVVRIYLLLKNNLTHSRHKETHRNHINKISL